MTDERPISTAFLANRHDLQAFLLSTNIGPTVAEDILQDVWVKLAEATQRGARIANVSAWCRTVAKNEVYAHWQRTQRRRETHSEIVELIDRGFSEQEQNRGSWTAHLDALRHCLAGLQDSARRLLEMRYVDGSDAPDISASLGGSYQAIMMKLSRLRQHLKNCVKSRLAKEAP